jgi:hypothetical protein
VRRDILVIATNRNGGIQRVARRLWRTDEQIAADMDRASPHSAPWTVTRMQPLRPVFPTADWSTSADGYRWVEYDDLQWEDARAAVMNGRVKRTLWPDDCLQGDYGWEYADGRRVEVEIKDGCECDDCVGNGAHVAIFVGYPANSSEKSA